MKHRTQIAVIATGIALAMQCAGQVTEREIRPAATKSVVLLQTAATTWFHTQSCVSCHHQALPLMVFALAEPRGVKLDRGALELIMTRSYSYLSDLDRAVQGSHVNGPIPNQASVLAGAVPLPIPRSASTGAYACLIARQQLADGHWVTSDARPPQSFSLFAATAIALRAVQLFLPDRMEAERRARIERAKSWLTRNSPRDTEDRVYQLFGLSWGGTPPEALINARDKLLAQQRADGGWGQTSGPASDAYATGETLVALSQAAGLPTSSSAFQKGLRYLLRTQKADGTWFVKSRIHPPAPLSPPYFESGLPYGHDQFISASGTSWATAALLLALPESPGFAPAMEFPSLKPADAPSWAETVLFGRTADMQRLLDSGWDPNSATPNGTTALMMAAPDFEKAALLIAHGASVNAKSKTRYTALMIAASHHATDSVILLLEHQAEVQPPKGQPALFGANPLFFAASSGDIQAVDALVKKGADLNSKMLLGGYDPMPPLRIAAWQGDSEMAGALIQSGVLVDGQDPDFGATALDLAVFKNDKKLAGLLIDAGAEVNHVDKLGFTPLHWAANVDFGDTAVLELLLKSGADPNARNKEGLTPLQIAVKYNHSRHQKVLEAAVARRGP